MKRLLFLFIPLVALLCAADSNSIQTQSDITGSGAAVAICSTCGWAKWVQIVALPANAANIRWGDVNTSASRGALIAPGGGQSLRPQIECPCYLPALYVFVAANDKVAVTWGN